jgi:hypothetical protein
MFGRLPSLVLRSLIFMLPAISGWSCSTAVHLSVLRDPTRQLDEKGLLPIRRYREIGDPVADGCRHFSALPKCHRVP